MLLLSFQLAHSLDNGLHIRKQQAIIKPTIKDLPRDPIDFVSGWDRSSLQCLCFLSICNQSKIKSGEQLHLFAGFLQLSSKYELVQNKVDLQEYK